jgi:hypothetical protein
MQMDQFKTNSNVFYRRKHFFNTGFGATTSIMDLDVYAIIMSFLVLTLPLVHSSCIKNTFIEIDLNKNTVGGIYGPTSLPVRLDQCEKVCRVLTNCMGINMEWTDKTAGYGYCEAFDALTSGNNRQSDPSFTLYGM